MRKLLLTICLLTMLAYTALALDKPKVTVSPDYQAVTFSFTIPGFFPPAGFQHWEISFYQDADSPWEFYIDDAQRAVTVELAEPLPPGEYIARCYIWANDAIHDSTKFFKFRVGEPQYIAWLDILANRGTWGVSFGVHNRSFTETLEYSLVFVDEFGAVVYVYDGVVDPLARDDFWTMTIPGLEDFSGSAYALGNVPFAVGQMWWDQGDAKFGLIAASGVR